MITRHITKDVIEYEIGEKYPILNTYVTTGCQTMMVFDSDLQIWYAIRFDLFGATVVGKYSEEEYMGTLEGKSL